MYADGARTMLRKRQEDGAEAKTSRAHVELEHAQKELVEIEIKSGSRCFEELKRKVMFVLNSSGK